MKQEFSPIFKALLKEGSFTNELLGAGATQIRVANYTKQGIYFQAFTSLATGLERIGKLCLILDYYVETKGSFPNASYLKNDIGHDLELLYEKSKEVITKNSITFRFSENLDTELHQNIMSVLSRFAKGDRYANINFVVNVLNGDLNPIGTWFETVDTIIFDRRISTKKKEKIVNTSRKVNAMLNHIYTVFHTSETGTDIRSIEEGSFRTGMYEVVAPHRQMLVLQIIRYWVELLGKMELRAQRLGKQEIPFFGEIFGAFYNDDSYFKTRKIWDKF